MKLVLFLLAILHIIITGGATLTSTDVVLSLKGQLIPTNGTGVVILKDIGGYLGPADGLICYDNSSSTSSVSQYWNYPNGTRISNLPSSDVFGTSNCNIRNGGSLYYSGVPKERGRFQCILDMPNYSWHVNITLNIVDMDITGPNLIWPGEIAIAGEDVELSINVTTFPEDISVPYQWSLNGTNLYHNSSRYQGLQTDTLTISNVQVEDQGLYACSVANSASGINGNSTKLIVVDVKVQVSRSTNDPETGKPYTLNCATSGVEALVNLQPEYEYSWLKDGQPFYDSQSTPSYTFTPVKFSDAGLYQCQVRVTFDRRLIMNRVTANGTSTPSPLTFKDAVYRIYLNIESDCHQWTSTSNMPNKYDDITDRIIQGIKDQCNHIQVKDDIIRNKDRAFECPMYPDETVVYSAHLYGNDLTNTSILVSCLDKWIKKTQRIVVNEVGLEINKGCTSVVDDMNSSLDCQTPSKSGITRDQGLAIGFGIISFLAIVVIIIGGIKWYYRSRKNADYNVVG